jgi:acetyl esterase/lipase
VPDDVGVSKMKKRITLSLLGLLWLLPLVHGGDFTLHSDMPYLEPERAEKLDIYLPKAVAGKVPVVLYIHGGGWTQGDKAWGIEKPNCESFAKEGYAVVSINYKLNTKGTCDAFPQNVYDCKTAIRWIRKEAATYGFDPDRIAVAGGSAGGHLALLMAYTPDVEELNRGALYPGVPVNVSCVINLFGIVDVRKWGFRSFISDTMPLEEQQRIKELVSPITHVNSSTVPTLVIHGTKDPTVPFSQAEALVETLKEFRVPHRFISVEGGQHAFPFIPHPRNMQTDLVPPVLEFLKKHLSI